MWDVLEGALQHGKECRDAVFALQASASAPSSVMVENFFTSSMNSFCLEDSERYLIMIMNDVGLVDEKIEKYFGYLARCEGNFHSKSTFWIKIQ